jgi:Holliday junction resolvase RusA-like endonuclease
MRDPLKFFVAGLPKGQPRPRARQQKGFIHIFTPTVADDWKMMVRFEAEKAWRANGYPCQFVGPLCVDLTFYFPRPNDHFRSNGELKASAPMWHTSKPDRDNCDKPVLDALTNLCIWSDDDQVCDGRIMKLYSNNRVSGCLIVIQEAVVRAVPTRAAAPSAQPQLI